MQSKEVVPELLSHLALSSTFDEEIKSIEKFAQENGLIEKVETSLEKAKLNLKWASKNVPTILDTIKKLLQTSK